MTTELSVVIKISGTTHLPTVKETAATLPDTVELVAVASPDAAPFVSTLQPDKLEQIGDERLTVARNIGADIATGEYVAFLDDDAVPANGWASRIISAFENADAVGGPLVPNWQTPARWLPEPYHWLIGCGPYYDEPQLVANTYGSNLAISKAAFEAVTGFNESIGMGSDGPQQGAETDLCRRLRDAGFDAVWYQPDAVVRHTVDSMSALSVFCRAYGQGQTKAQLGTGARESNFVRQELLSQQYRGLADLATTVALTATVGSGYLRARVANGIEGLLS